MLSIIIPARNEADNLKDILDYFNTIHKWHVECSNNEKVIAGVLFVIVNNDNQRRLKVSNKFLKKQERIFIVSNY